MENLTTRRNLIKTAAFTAASFSRVMGANDRLAVSIIGTGRRSRDVGKALLGTGKVDIVGLCDIYDVQRKATRDVLGITNKLQSMLQEHPLCASFITPLDALARQYQFEAMLGHLQKALDEPVH